MRRYYLLLYEPLISSSTTRARVPSPCSRMRKRDCCRSMHSALASPLPSSTRRAAACVLYCSSGSTSPSGLTVNTLVLSLWAPAGTSSFIQMLWLIVFATLGSLMGWVNDSSSVLSVVKFPSIILLSTKQTCCVWQGGWRSTTRFVPQFLFLSIALSRLVANVSRCTSQRSCSNPCITL